MSVFDRIYKDNVWNGIDSRSGPGSGIVPTRHVGEFIDQFVAQESIHTMLDFGCGDCNWMSNIPGYLGVDVSQEAIRLAQRKHPFRAFRVITGVRDLLGTHWDMVFSRDVMQHSSTERNRDFLAAIASFDPRWMMLSTYRDGINDSIEDGAYFRINLNAEPYNLLEPDIWVPDGFDYFSDTRNADRDPGRFMGVWRMK